MSGELTVDIQLACESNDLPTDAELIRWAEAGFRGDEAREVTLRIVDEAESTELNGRYRDKHRPTNVLSFPFEAPPGIELGLLGDLVICAPVVAREAREQQKSPTAHWAHMIIHGMLHLQGYDHIEPREAEVMEQLETRLVTGLGFAPPYPDEEADRRS